MIRRSYTYLNNDTVKTLYTSLIRPHLKYGNTAWTPRFKKDMSLIESVQRCSTKLSPAIKDLPYEHRLRILNLPSLYYRRARGDMIETFKHMTGRYAVDASYLKLDNSKTRGHIYKLKKERVKKQSDSYSTVTG